jgi:large subunit ribosomal protein L25
VVTENSTIQVESEATHIPELIEVSIQGLPIGTQIHARDLSLPEGTTLLADEDLLIINVTQQISAEALEAELEEAEAEAGIVHEEAETEVAEGEAAEGAEGESTEGESTDSE